MLARKQMDSFRESPKNMVLKNSQYQVREHGEAQVLSKAALHSWQFDKNPGHVAAHINHLKFGEIPPTRPLVIGEASQDYLSRYEALHNLGHVDV